MLLFMIFHMKRSLLLTAGLLCMPLSLVLADESPKLNIILIMADDLGYETIGANGGESYKTPRIDQMAAKGVRFTECHAQPICTPSRVQIMTGKYNFRNYIQFGRLKRGEKTFAHYLKDSGYATCIAGKWQLGKEKDSPQHFGFEQSLLWQHTRPRTKVDTGKEYDSRFSNPYLERNGVEEDYTNGEFAPDLCTEFICEFIDKNKEKPFLVYYPMILTHCPFVPVPNGADWDPKDPGSLTYKGDPKYFGGMVSYMDLLVGRIIDKVEEQGLSDKTVILFTGDNGTDRPIVSKWNGQDYVWGKGKTSDNGTRVPLVTFHPQMKEPKVVDDLVNFTDVLPTLCELAGVSFESKDLVLDGQSIVPQLKGEEGKPRAYSYCWYDPSGKRKSPKVFARTKQYKLYRGGRFYDVKKDRYETTPLELERLNESEKQVRDMLQSVIDGYNKQGA